MTTTVPERLFGLLTEAMTKDRDFAQRATAHVRAKTNHNTIVNFANNGATDDDKVKMYAFLLTGYRKKDYSGFEGGLAIGQAAVQAEETEKVEEKEKPAPKARQPKPVIVEAEEIAPASDAASDFVRSLRALVGQPAPAKIEIDEEKVVALISSHASGFHTQLTDELRKTVQDYLKAIPPRDCVEIRRGDEIVTIEGATHWQLPQIITWVNANVPLWVWGGAGGGKTTLGRQIAAALKLEPYIISVDPTMTVGKLMGFRNLATGEFMEGYLYKPFKQGGLVKLDEIDTGDPGIIASANALLANDYYMFPNGETVQRHADFRIIAGANTKGCGAVAGYTARNRLDAATLDRFAVIELAYDEQLERAIALNEPITPAKHWDSVVNSPEKLKEWVDYVQKVRAKVGTSVLVSPRASILGTRALRAGIPPAEVADALLFKLTTPDTKNNIINQVGRFE